jgi:hypothetical protein
VKLARWCLGSGWVEWEGARSPRGSDGFGCRERV